MPTVHASCVAIGETGVMLLGPSGAGKSDLALRLIDGGAILVADDQVVLRAEGGRLVADPPPTLAGRIEVRGLGIAELPWRGGVAVGLAVRLSDTAPARLPEPRSWSCAEIAVPSIDLAPFEASATAKVRLAVTGGWSDSALSPESGGGKTERR